MNAFIHLTLPFHKTCKVLVLMRTENTRLYKLICLPRNSVDFLRPRSGKEMSVVKLGMAPINTCSKKNLSGFGKDVEVSS